MFESIAVALLERLIKWAFEKGKEALLLALLKKHAHKAIDAQVGAHIEAAANVMTNPSEENVNDLIDKARKLVTPNSTR